MRLCLNALKLLHLELFKDCKNLLAFSGGVDSSALFFLLKDLGVSFDIAIVNYATRAQSKLEVAYAQELATQYGKKAHVLNAPKIHANFEHNARAVRYEFFKNLCLNEGYKNVLLAHQLNDRLEWFLMQLARGSGIEGLLSLQCVSEFEGIRLVRPLLESSRKEICAYVAQRGIKYFDDASNEDLRFKRNFFRHNFSNKLLECAPKGILQSFRILDSQNALFSQGAQSVEKILDNLFVCARNSKNQYLENECAENQYLESQKDMRNVDFVLKNLGYVMSFKQRQEVLKSGFDCELGGRFVVACVGKLLFIARKNFPPPRAMPKKIKEQYRLYKIPPKIRPVLFQAEIVDEKLEALKKMLDSLES
ncbi:tRNA lysidine(34) synthetase TilS [Helicobacter sp. MIT 00-7814]|nr:tRNA lysidine(34) synthetase TilS [Helicobacter sp. MIT 99-10781]RDU56097.1 tRNA lysidine(34) synthetase TilS [Helicobacter sp. MIT 00-7814]